MHRRRPVRPSAVAALAAALLSTQAIPAEALITVHAQGHASRAKSGPMLLWSERVGTEGADSVLGVVVHEQGIYLHGETLPISSFKESYSENEVFVQRWSLDGELLWTHTFGEPSADNLINQMSIDADGDVTLVVGPSTDEEDYQSHAYRALLHLSGADGSEVWRQHIAAVPLYGAIVVTDEAVFAAFTWKGSRYGAPAYGGFDAVLTRFGLESGEVEWVHQAGSPKRDGFGSLVIGPDGFLYAGGTTSGAWNGAGPHIGGQDFVLTKIDRDTGEAEWAKQVGTARNDYLNVRDVDGRGVTVTGMTFGSFGGSRSTEEPGVAMDFSLSGKQRWVDQLPSSASYVGEAESKGKTLYTVGRARDGIATAGRPRGMSFLRAVRSNGKARWTVQFAGKSEAYRLAVGQGRIVVVGETYDKRAFGSRQGPSDGYITVWKG